MVLYFKFFQRAFVVILCAVALISYTSPSFFYYISQEMMPPHISLFIVTSALVASHYYIEFELKQVIRMEEKRKELQGQLKDAEKLLVDKMDPQLLETVKKVMRLEMTGEIDAMRNN